MHETAITIAIAGGSILAADCYFYILPEWIMKKVLQKTEGTFADDPYMISEVSTSFISDYREQTSVILKLMTAWGMYRELCDTEVPEDPEDSE